MLKNWPTSLFQRQAKMAFAFVLIGCFFIILGTFVWICTSLSPVQLGWIERVLIFTIFFIAFGAVFYGAFGVS